MPIASPVCPAHYTDRVGEDGAPLSLKFPNEILVVPTQYSDPIPPEAVGLVLPKASAAEQGLFVVPGVIDSTHQGAVHIQAPGDFLEKSGLSPFMSASSIPELDTDEPPVPGPPVPVSVEVPATMDQQQVLARLQLLEQQVVGGEQAKNKDLKEKRQRRKRLADERKLQLLEALQGSDVDSSDWVLLNVYDSIQEEVRAKNKLLEKMKEKLRAAEAEIRDIQYEFELEKIDYLATIRQQERELLLHQQLLEQVQPLIRRDCNYSNFDKIKRESIWDEDADCWKVPEPVTERTSLPVVSSSSQTKAGKKSSALEHREASTEEEDRYKTMLSKSDSENIASSYFRSKRASQILSSADSAKSLASHNPLSHPASSSMAPVPSTQTAEMPQLRPFRLESLDFSMPSTKTRRKKNRNIKSGDPF
ncbi:kinesin-like protein KIF17 [Sphaerodactylus townsendi]|uniref:kinesin-like protein KIF17 n=1 Tax=Sphaerodactylus townsendi TaxID=933632 RepID=UPI0020270F02|nr:kinesin-like protein KIF17 [Sphaerodactylus townsendi]